MIHYCLKSVALRVKINNSYFRGTTITLSLNNENIIKNIIEEFGRKITIIKIRNGVKIN